MKSGGTFRGWKLHVGTEALGQTLGFYHLARLPVLSVLPDCGHYVTGYASAIVPPLLWWVVSLFKV